MKTKKLFTWWCVRNLKKNTLIITPQCKWKFPKRKKEVPPYVYVENPPFIQNPLSVVENFLRRLDFLLAPLNQFVSLSLSNFLLVWFLVLWKVCFVRSICSSYSVRKIFDFSVFNIYIIFFAAEFPSDYLFIYISVILELVLTIVTLFLEIIFHNDAHIKTFYLQIEFAEETWKA